MQTILKSPSASPLATTAITAQRIATAYLTTALGPTYRAGQSVLR